MGRKIKDLTGQRFGRLTVIRYMGLNRHGKAVWECRCDCDGNLVNIAGNSLTYGYTKSCGCLKRESIGRTGKIYGKGNAKDITGRRFGRLTALYPTDKRRGRGVIWKCSCEGPHHDRNKKLVEVSAGHLISGAVLSCGCYHREQASKQFLVHGLSKTKEYKRTQDIKRREKENYLDGQWTTSMTFAIHECFPVCVLCGRTEEENFALYNKPLAMDHVLPLSQGNGLKPGNAVVLCTGCNSAKQGRTLDRLPEQDRTRLQQAAEEFLYYWEATKDNNYYLE